MCGGKRRKEGEAEGVPQDIEVLLVLPDSSRGKGKGEKGLRESLTYTC